MKRFALALLLGLLACRARPLASDPPPALLGEFEDDYGIRYTVTETTWTLEPDWVFEIERWVPQERYLVARNGANNPEDAGLWSRIDWMELDPGTEWRFGFCLSAYDAPDARAAESVEVAERDTPLTGCNGFPFSRLRPVER